MPSKIHYLSEGALRTPCWTGAKVTTKGYRTTDRVQDVTCLRCMKTPAFKRAEEVYLTAKQEAFDAQEPREFHESWRDGVIECGNCGGRLFREADRTCYGHYANYVCANCNAVEQRLTETGMSF